MALEDFRFPVRDAEIFFGDDGEQRPEEDKAADLEFNQRAVEDYLSNTLPTVYIQQSGVGTGTIDPAQLATGTAAAGKAPVGSPPAWTDITTQAEYDAGIGGTYTSAADIQRGRYSTGMTGTNSIFAVAFSSTFASVPRVVATIESGAGIGMFPTLTVVNTTSFAGYIFASSSTTATCHVHWHAVKQ